MIKIALFASGNGSNVQRISEYFKNSNEIQIELVLCNNSKAGVLNRCKDLKLKSMVFDKYDLYESNKVTDMLAFYRIDFIVLAGFLWLIPKSIITAYSNNIINIHPALSLKKYGGKGMYGMKVHKAVISNKEKASGITIHYVNEKYDDGDIIFQSTCKIDADETPESLANKIHLLEYKHFPETIEKILKIC